MQFTVTAILALAAAAFAQDPTADFNPIFTPEEEQVVQAGSEFEVKWEAPEEYAGEKVSISLIGGDSQDTLVPIADLASGLDNAAESWMWPVDASLGEDALYGLVMRLDSNPDIFQYSQPFKIESGDGEGKPTVTMTAPTHGVVTVTLSSCEPTTTSETPSSTPEPTTTAVNTTTEATWVTTPSQVPSTTEVEVPTEAEPTTVPTDESAGASLRASSLALVGGLAMAFFAL